MSTYDIAPAVHWVKEREKVRVLKEDHDSFVAKGGLVVSPGPVCFSEDPIIAEWRFCNVRREDDRVTVWIRKEIRERFYGHPMMWLMLAIARQINWPDTLAALIASPDAWPADDRFSPDRLAVAIDAYAERGGKVFTGAYIIPAPQKKGVKKSAFLAETVIGRLWKDRAKFAEYLKYEGRTLRGYHGMLTAHDGWGPFLAYQATVDLRFTPWMDQARDVATWCAAGPGTLRGLNRMYGRPIDEPISQDRACSRLVRMWPELIQATNVPMDLSDVPNVMCEVDKYLRVKNGEGKPRARYVPGRGY